MWEIHNINKGNLPLEKRLVKKTLFVVLAVLALAVGSAFAQNGAFAPYVNGGVTYSANTGTSNPGFVGGLGVESSTKHLLLDLNGTINTANPATNAATLFQVKGKGYTGTVTGSAYLKVAKHFLVGGGAFWQISPGTYQSITDGSTSAKVKLDATLQSAHPFIGGGFQTKYNRLLATYALPGKDALTNEKIIPITNEFFVGKHLRLTQSVTIVSYSGVAGPNYFDYSVGGVRVAGTTLGAGVKYVF